MTRETATSYTGELEEIRRDDSNLILKIKLKNALNKKMRLTVWDYLQGEYLLLLIGRGLTMKYKMYIISKEKDIAN